MGKEGGLGLREGVTAFAAPSEEGAKPFITEGESGSHRTVEDRRRKGVAVELSITLHSTCHQTHHFTPSLNQEERPGANSKIPRTHLFRLKALFLRNCGSSSVTWCHMFIILRKMAPRL